MRVLTIALVMVVGVGGLLLWPATAGQVKVNGNPVSGPLNFVGMAFQNPTLLPWRTALDNVMLPLEIVKQHCDRLSRERAAYEAKARAHGDAYQAM